MENFNEFFNAYLECALWSSIDCMSEENCPDPLDENYDISDINPIVRHNLEIEAKDFYNSALSLIKKDNISFSQAGHDFWLTRNGHGAGFWDRGTPNGDKLTKLSETYSDCKLYSYDGQIFAMGYESSTRYGEA